MMTQADHQELDARERAAEKILENVKVILEEFENDPESASELTPSMTVAALRGLALQVANLARLMQSTQAELHAIPRPTGVTFKDGGIVAHIEPVTGENRADV